MESAPQAGVRESVAAWADTHAQNVSADAAKECVCTKSYNADDAPACWSRMA
jgi:hypothetical protein